VGEARNLTIEQLHNKQELFNRLASGDVEAFTSIFHFYTRKLYPWLLRKTKDPSIAEELIQDCFLKIWINRDRLRQMENPEGYIYRIAANLILDHFRKLEIEHKIINRFKQQNTTAFATSTENITDFRETQKLIDEAVSQLPQQRKIIYTLRQDGLSYDEIAAKLGLSSNTVRNQLIAAGKFIRTCLSEHGISSLALISVYTSL
jgi:RNA polymerase sigma-70 factor (family 1)